jgi:quinol monooxygenase YgiN
MPITEIALVHLSPDVTDDDVALRSKLTHAKTVMQDYTGRRFYYLQQLENPAYLYIIGEWESLDQHLIHFIPGPSNQALLESLERDLAVEWLLHINASHTELPLPKSDNEKKKAYHGDLIWSIARNFVKIGERENFEQAFAINKQHLQDFVTEGTVGGGWRVDNDGDKEEEEWVLLCPWASKAQHSDFEETDAFAKYGLIREHIVSTEIKLAKLLDI